MKPPTYHAVMVLLAALNAPALFAAPGCNNADFQGVYGMLASGTVLVAPGFLPSYLGPIVRVGRVFADGKGLSR